ncbi:HpcH/HpaI aldolase/citrate lyase family protein [Shumkonia mesophila]|uniref:HpcH/HpaI aldolase/citrate lyase family protein n=1 Tax=Shumkonia mesophila TaxID=2838854 RepID=UPI00293495D5|nr:aldolase/citrate lyase family protein [Shumkonia mesophila]
MMMRSLLYVPASSERFVAKAHERGAHAIILDLEDGVAPAEKTAARAALAAAVPAVGRNGAKVFVRINATADRLAADAEAACRAGAFGLFVPKTQTAQRLGELVTLLECVEGDCRRMPTVLVPLLEDPGAVLDARIIVGAPRVFALICGTEDLATALGGEPTPDVLRLPKLMVHMAAKAAGVRSFGMLRSVADYADTEAIALAAREARSFGFDGATCVHPGVVAVLNRAFAPTADEVARAERMVDAAKAAFAAGMGAFVFEGKMVDEPIIARARALLASR